jgi:hypothetical protein
VTRISTLLVAVAMVSIVAPPASARAADCPDVAMFGVAGSGQAPGFGVQVRGVTDRVSSRLATAGRTISVQPVDYPAVDLLRTLGLALFDGRYEDSVATGAVNLVADVSAHVERCPDSVLVIVGYSQGAQVVKAAGPALPIEARLGAVVVLADPTSDPGQRGVFRIGTDNRGDSGWLGAEPVPDRIRAMTIDVCATGDIVCGGGRFRFGAHANGYEGQLIDRIADIAASKALAAKVFWSWF